MLSSSMLVVLGARIQRGLTVKPQMRRLFNEWMENLKANNLVVAYRPDRGFFYTHPREGLDVLDGIPVKMPPRTVSDSP